ncbi:MAG: hypothetical protein IJJ26_11135 [Victivallales bacterium]|nr:hypothetical protein [Victivallales bacterium]
MISEKQLVQKIEQLLAAGQLENDASLRAIASQFAEVGQGAAARLTRCKELLAQGNRSDAVAEARAVPDLLELAETLEFPNARKWRNLCLDAGLPAAPELSAADLEQLRRSIEAEKELEPLLKEYRRCVYQGERSKCIKLLRTIREMDPGNPGWIENLRPLEEETLPTIIEETEHALSLDDRPALASLFEELSNPWRAVKPPQDLVNRVRHVLLAERSKELRIEAEALLGHLRRALDSDNDAEIDALRPKIEKISSDQAFLDKPDVWDRALQTLRERDKAKAAAAKHREEQLKELDPIQDILDTPKIDERRLREEWERINARCIPVTDLLRHKVTSTLENLERSRRARAKALGWGIGAVLVIALLAAGGYFFVTNRQASRDVRVSELERLLESGDYSTLRTYLDQLEADDPVLATEARVKDIQKKLDSAVKKQKADREAFDLCMDQLQQLRSMNYEGNAEDIRNLLQTATEAARKVDSTAVAQVRSWRTGWEEWTARRASQADGELQVAVASLNAALDEAAQHPYNDQALERAKIEELKEIASRCTPYLATASEVQRVALQTARERLEAWERRFQERSAEMAKTAGELQALRRALEAVPTDFSQYKSLLEKYQKLAPEGDALRESCRRILHDIPMFQGAVALANFDVDALPPGAAAAPVIQKLLDGAARGSIWESDLRKLNRLATREKTVRGQLNALTREHPELLQMYYFKYRERGTEKWKTLYFPKMLMSRVMKDENDKEYTTYWGSVYHAFEPTEKPSLVHTKNAFPKGLTTQYYEFEVQRKVEDNRCEYPKFLFEYIADASTAKNIPQYLLEGIRKMMDNTKVEPVLRAQFIKRVAAILAENYAEFVPELSAIADAFANVNTDAPWMNEENPDTISATEALRSAVLNCPAPEGLVARLKNVTAVLQRAVDVQLHCVGTITQDADGALTVRAGTGYRELWGIFPLQGQGPTFLVLNGEDGSIPSTMLERCYMGMPVFAPAAGYQARGAFQELNLKQGEADGLQRPNSWPANAWN